MSSKAGKIKKEIVGQRITTVFDVLTIMQNEASKMSWWQRLKLAHRFLWNGNIDSFFQLADTNKKKVKHEKKKTV